jgi:hypothetical protein
MQQNTTQVRPVFSACGSMPVHNSYPQRIAGVDGAVSASLKVY